jgi:hypothetical protein
MSQRVSARIVRQVFTLGKKKDYWFKTKAASSLREQNWRLPKSWFTAQTTGRNLYTSANAQNIIFKALIPISFR